MGVYNLDVFHTGPEGVETEVLLLVSRPRAATAPAGTGTGTDQPFSYVSRALVSFVARPRACVVRFTGDDEPRHGETWPWYVGGGE